VQHIQLLPPLPKMPQGKAQQTVFQANVSCDVAASQIFLHQSPAHTSFVDATLARLRYGAKLQRETGKPILVTGGKPLGNSISEAQQMRIALEQDFRVPVRWTEDESDNTFENAHHSFRILQQAGIRKIYLVTHAWHIPRSAEIFRRAGFEVVEAPTAFTTRYQIDLLAFLPRAESLHDSKIFIHEVIGLLWYRVKLAIFNS
jgi:uncharacterized SAM-binding protein YcdF (DUF218 family)